LNRATAKNISIIDHDISIILNKKHTTRAKDRNIKDNINITTHSMGVIFKIFLSIILKFIKIKKLQVTLCLVS